MTNHFLSIDDLDSQTLQQLITSAYTLQPLPQPQQHPVCLCFCEPSTRTRVSFELAATRLQLPVVDVPVSTSSLSKGESMLDMARNIEAMGFAAMVLRHQSMEVMQTIADNMQTLSIINAGAGTQAHPSQALLDCVTITQAKGGIAGLNVAIIGNISHSRVAYSDMQALLKLGVNSIRLVGPQNWLPEQTLDERIQCYTDMQEGITQADVVIMLRIQHERLAQDEQLDLQQYRHDYQLTQARLSDAHADAIVLHPGPMNRGVEIDDAVADGPQSQILRQVHHGVAARMAIFAWMLAQK